MNFGSVTTSISCLKWFKVKATWNISHCVRHNEFGQLTEVEIHVSDGGIKLISIRKCSKCSMVECWMDTSYFTMPFAERHSTDCVSKAPVIKQASLVHQNKTTIWCIEEIESRLKQHFLVFSGQKNIKSHHTCLQWDKLNEYFTPITTNRVAVKQTCRNWLHFAASQSKHDWSHWVCLQMTECRGSESISLKRRWRANKCQASWWKPQLHSIAAENSRWHFYYHRQDTQCFFAVDCLQPHSECFNFVCCLQIPRRTISSE